MTAKLYIFPTPQEAFAKRVCRGLDMSMDEFVRLVIAVSPKFQRLIASSTPTETK